MKARFVGKAGALFMLMCLVYSLPSMGQDLLSEWAHRKKMTINTTPTGYNVQSSVAGFPYLVRLSEKSFNFNEADSLGRDIRFASNNEDPFDHEILYWNKAEKKAAVWVSIMAVQGNSDDQFFYMYWGKPGAEDLSNGPVVFDTANGFASVWHLSGNVKDASHKANHCTANGTVDDTASIIGKARRFNGTSDYLGFLPAWTACPEQGISFSAWIRPDSMVGQIIYNGDNAETNFRLDGNLSLNHKFTGGSWFGAKGAGEGLQLGKWCLVTAVWKKGSTVAIYINGEKSSSLDSIPDELLNDPGVLYKPTIGAYNRASNFFKGSMCEVRIMKIAPSDDWIKLCYQNQKINPEGIATIRYPNKNLFVKVGTSLTAVTPVISDLVDQVTIDPPLLDYLAIDAKTGAISGLGNDTCTNRQHIISATNFYGSTCDTIYITVGNNQSGVLIGGQNIGARFSLVNVKGCPELIIPAEISRSYKNPTCALFDCAGRKVWSSRMAGLISGKQSILIGKGSRLSGFYLLKITGTDFAGNERTLGNAKVTVLGQ